MSNDEKEWLKGTPFSKWLTRLKELEQKLSSLTKEIRRKTPDFAYEIDHRNIQERIEKLEKQFAPEFMEQFYMPHIRDLFKGISETKEALRKLFKRNKRKCHNDIDWGGVEWYDEQLEKLENFDCDHESKHTDIKGELSELKRKVGKLSEGKK